MKPLVSIIVAIYKSEKFLDKLIKSLINQTYDNIEIILVDDGSPDKSGEICDYWASCDKRIRVIHKVNGGACEARNEGLKAVTGDYISIIDGDDWLESEYVEYLINMIDKTGAQMAMTDAIFTTRDREQVKHDRIKVITAEEATADILYPIIPIGPWNKLYSTKLIKNNNITFCTPWSGEGLYFSVMAAQCANRIALGHRKIYNYRLNNTNSGLTHYNVQIGINALYNIKNIGENLRVRTKKTVHAVNWHIWKNYNYLLFLIIATNSIEENKTLYNDCLKNIRRRLPRVLVESDFGPRNKAKMLFTGIFPRTKAKIDLKNQLQARSKDHME